MKPITFETGVWGLSWSDASSDSAVQGVAELLTTGGVQLDIPFGSVLGFDLEVGAKRSSHADYVFGITNKAERIVLKNCDGRNTTIHLPGVEHQKVAASYLLHSKQEFDPTCLITSFDVELDQLINWVGKNFLKEELSFEDGKGIISDTIELNKSELEDIELLCESGLTITLLPVVTRCAHKVEMASFSSKCILRISCDSPIEFEQMNDIMHELQTFFSFCMGWYTQINTVRYTNTEGATISCYANYISNDKELSTSAVAQMPLSYSRIKEKVGLLISSWMNASDELNAAKGTFVPLATLSKSSYMDLQFLAAAQTLEALARDGRETKEMEDEDFASLLESISSQIADDSERNWALQKLRYCNRVSQSRLIKDLYDSIGAYAKEIFPKRSTFVGKHVDMRNNIAHRNPDAIGIAGDFLFYHTQGVVLLCYVGIMRKLGLSEDEVSDIMRKSNFRWYLKDKAAELYQKR